MSWNVFAKQVFWFTGIIVISFVLRLCLLLTETSIFKFLSVVVYKHLININHDFAAFFLNLANSQAAGFLGFIAIYTHDICHDSTKYIGVPYELAFNTPIQFE